MAVPLPQLPHNMVPLLSLLILTLSTRLPVHGSPPEPVVKCKSGNADCTVTNGYGAFPDRSTCRVAAVAYPASENELIAAVSDAAEKKQHMKVVTFYAHSIPKLSCPGGPDGAGLVISTQKLNKVVAVDRKANPMAFQSGIGLRQLIDAAAAEGLALPHTPYWQGISLGGLLATGSHGSSLSGKGSAVHEYVVAMRLVVPASSPAAGGLYAKAVDLGEGDPDLLAAKVSLGVLGAVSQVTLQLEPMFKRSITNRVQKDAGFESTLESFAATTEFGDVTWYAGQGIVVYRDDVRRPISTPGEGKNDYIGFRAHPSVLLASMRTSEEILEATDNSDGKCLLAEAQLNTLPGIGFGFRNNAQVNTIPGIGIGGLSSIPGIGIGGLSAIPGIGGFGFGNNDGRLLEFTGYPVIGNNSDLQGSGSCQTGKEDGLLTACVWDPRVGGLFYHKTAASIPLPSIAAFIADVKKLRELRPNSLCGLDLYDGLMMRFVRSSTAYLGKTDDSVEIDMTYFRSRDPADPRLDEDVLEEVEQMALFKYGGLPHWGKNRNVGFLKIRDKYGARVEHFATAMAKYDPEGLFSSDWTDAVLGLRGKSLVVDRAGCALEGLCICSRDEHCAPAKGYVCRPGLVYKEARVCRKVGENERAEAAVHTEP